MIFLSRLNILGAIAVTVMMMAYIGEDKSSKYTFLFAISCIGASAYGWVSGTWPFGVIEAVWAAFAFRKWYGRAKVEGAKT